MDKSISFDETRHEYTVGGVAVPSVSDIIAPLSAENYARVNDSVRAAAAARGRAIHSACEDIDYGIEPDEVDPSIVPYLAAYAQFLKDYSPTWSGVERVVAFWASDNSMHPLYCGTLDRLGVIGDQRCVVDIKTYSTIKADGYMAACCQTALYAMAVEDSDALDKPLKRLLLHLRKDGTYRLADLNRWELDHGFPGRPVACELLHVYWACRQVRDAVKR